MTAPWRAAAASVLAAIACFSGSRTAAAEPAVRTMSIVLLNAAGAPDRVLTRAETAAGRIFDQAGIHLSWRRASGVGQAVEPAAAQDLTPVLFVTLMSTSMEAAVRHPGVAVGFVQPGTRVANIMYRRVERVALQRPEDLGAFLGHVIAHEIGHLLLPPGPLGRRHHEGRSRSHSCCPGRVVVQFP